MSIGGMINMENPNCVSYETNKDGGVVRVLNDVELDHIAATRKNQAANSNTGFSHAIVKSMEDAGYTFKSDESAVSDISSLDSISAEVESELQKEFGILFEDSVEKNPFGDEDDVQTSADPFDGHRHWIRVDSHGNGQTSTAGSPSHAHVAREFKVVDVTLTPEYTSKHSGLIPKQATKSEISEDSNLIEKPYSGPDDETVPDHVKKRGKRAREIWVKAWNSAFEKCRQMGGEGKTCESTAFAIANSVLGRIKENDMSNDKTAKSDSAVTTISASAVDTEVVKSDDPIEAGVDFLQKVGKALTRSGLSETESDVSKDDETSEEISADSESAVAVLTETEDKIEDETTDLITEDGVAEETETTGAVVEDTEASESDEEISEDVEEASEKSTASTIPDSEILGALTTLQKAVEMGVPEHLNDSIRAALDSLQKSVGNAVAEDFLSAAETSKALQDLPAQLEKWAETVLLTGLTTVIEKVGAQTGQLEKAIKSLGGRMAVIEEIEGGSANSAEGLSEDSRAIAKSDNPDDVFTGIFAGAAKRATRKI